MKLILGSSSVFRRKVLEDAGIEFEVVEPEIDEKKIRALAPSDTPLLISFEKAKAVAKLINEPAIIIACDQVIGCCNRVLEKPRDAKEVQEWYQMYTSGDVVYYMNGITVHNTETGEYLSAKEIAIANFTFIPEEFTEEQIRKGVVFDCSGAIDDEVQEKYATIIKGSKDSTIGLPLKFVMDMVKKVKKAPDESFELFHNRPEFKKAAERFNAFGPLGVTAEDHEGIGSTPPKILLDNPGKTKGELMTSEEIKDWFKESEEQIAEFSKDEYADNAFAKSALPRVQQNLELSRSYLSSIGKLP